MKNATFADEHILYFQQIRSMNKRCKPLYSRQFEIEIY